MESKNQANNFSYFELSVTKGTSRDKIIEYLKTSKLSKFNYSIFDIRFNQYRKP
jgi:hypothetical protein